jgi:hypothetical protein
MIVRRRWQNISPLVWNGTTGPFIRVVRRVVFQQRRFHTTSVFEREGQVAQTGFEPGFQRLFGRTRKGYVGRPDFYEENGAVEIQQLAQRGDREIYFFGDHKIDGASYRLSEPLQWCTAVRP